MKYAMVAVDDLIPYVNNARTHSDEQVTQIAASIKEFGFLNPIITDGNRGVVAGHGRLAAAKKLGLEEVPTVEAAHLSDAQRKAYVLADNQLAMNAGWDNDLLKIELAELGELDFDLDLLGFDDALLDGLLADPVEGLTDEDSVPEAPDEPITKPGDLWVLGDHRLLCGDATNADHFSKLMNGRLADLLITDPPYNVDYTGKTKDALKIKNDKKSDEDFLQFLKDYAALCYVSMKPGASYYVWHADSEGLSFRRSMVESGFSLRQCLIWKKDVMVMGRQDYHWSHEPCLYGWKDGASHLWCSDRKQTTVLEFKRPKRNEVHPTMKPVELIEYQMLNNSRGQDIVLDPFLGSGTTLIAAEKNNRICYGMELDPKYCDVIVKRWEDFTGKKAELLESD